MTNVVGPNHARNEFFRNAYREATPAIRDEIEKKLSSPYTPAARDYPSTAASLESRKRAQSMARLQVAYDTIWGHFGSRVERFDETFRLLKAMTMKRDDMSKMAAMKIVLPRDWDIDVGSKRVEFLDSATGLVARLRMSADHRNPSAIILRGKSSVLAKAADELVRACPAVEVFQLGEVAAFGYEVKQLWPVIEDAPDGGASLPDGRVDTIWVHKEHEPYWIDQSYEKTPRPQEWTVDSLEAYITTLVFGRLRPHLAATLYNSDSVDADGVRIKLMLQALTDPAARAHITPGILKLAMAFMVRRGGHRAAADRLLKLAEEWGMPMDTDLFNIMLEGYAAKHDVGFFHKFLLKMQARYFHPNIRTWILFLQLVQKDMERRQVIVAMYDLSFFKDPATRRGIAKTMASHDAYVAFRAGKKLDTFMAEQVSRYGSDWFTTGCLDRILAEFFHFHDVKHPRHGDFKKLIERQSEDGQAVGISTVNLVLRHCVPSRNWTAALWALDEMARRRIEPDAQTYDLLIALAVASHSPGALGVAFFYAVLARGLRTSARARMHDILTKRNVAPFWRAHSPKIFAKRMGRYLRLIHRARKANAVAAAEFVILRECDGFRPVKSLAYSLGVALRTMDGPFHQQLNMSKPPAGPAGEDDPSTTLHHHHHHHHHQQWPVVKDMAIRLRAPDRDGEPVKMTVHLDACFVPQAMIKWHRRPEHDARRETVADDDVDEDEQTLAVAWQTMDGHDPAAH
ncbi:Pentatricopeptide repeat-containing protein [Escovopsis weberi]|uniref:Pentatricopeptide repeat-containing protein n=1 Tax=Escovopsis weberi TaxID=150374 RepID=A0A0M8N6B9_ESCWE|nr:Pentatricopeptide repeat-containing protein [Escovopsis weberi]